MAGRDGSRRRGVVVQAGGLSHAGAAVRGPRRVDRGVRPGGGEALARPEGLSALAAGHDDGERVSLRWILCHLIEEYARHNGHADLIRESIDGETGVGPTSGDDGRQ
ncbi:MAG: DUF664 domain-containing protein [Candidatus Nanopelagicales bacterium]